MDDEAIPDDKLAATKLEFLIQDYWQKVGYLTGHFTRLWNRFNYFLTIQSALFGASILAPGEYRRSVPIFAALVCALWYIFGAQDRYLVQLYRKEIEQALEQIRPRLRLTNYYFVGQTENTTNQEARIEDFDIEQNIYQWRREFLSTTKLPALFPLILIVMWLTMFFVLVWKS
jgi:hypothetical protein